MKRKYQDFRFERKTRALITHIDAICTEYRQQGYTLSVRQIYYQLVARNMLANTEANYKMCARTCNDGRMAGLIDWDAIEDRNRDIEGRTRWDSGSAIIDACAQSFHMDMWENQAHRVIVIVEKAALAGVVGTVCAKYDVPLLAARGYPSVSIIRELSLQHIAPAMSVYDKDVTILHLGDHDPSGIDMTRDLDERISTFVFAEAVAPETRLHLKRIALNMPQIEELNPPPNPAKVTDSRFAGYQQLHGDESWELDALNPSYLAKLVTDHITPLIDPQRWAAREKQIQHVKERLKHTAKEYRDEII